MSKKKNDQEKNPKKSLKKSTKPISDYHKAKSEECRKLREEIIESVKESSKGGRPTKYNQEMADYIIDRVASSKCGLHILCKADPKMPAQDTINEWRWKYPEFSA